MMNVNGAKSLRMSGGECQRDVRQSEFFSQTHDRFGTSSFWQTSSPHVNRLAAIAARPGGDAMHRAENPAQIMHLGARAENNRALLRLIDVRIGLKMRDQFGVAIDRVANAPGAER